MDVVLLLGPLYHLTDQDDRVRALREVARVLRPGGLVLAAAISRWASTLDGLTRGHFTDPNFVSIVEQALKDGQHRNVTDRLEYFTTAYFHQPDELLGEVEAAHLALLGLYGLEGPGWLLPDLVAWLDQASSRETLLTLARLVEADPSTLSLSAHWLAVARKPLPSAAS